jgi:peptidoglycan/LPS O-acetylase OafA/YrhL
VSKLSESRDAGDGFGLLRIAAALMVIETHAFPLVGTPEPRWHQGGVDVVFGSFAVPIFFVISGYLVLASWQRDPNPARFILRRVARIWPGLFVMLVVTTFLMGPLITTRSLGTYLSDPWTGGYLLGNMFLLPVYSLPGVFEHNLYHGVNGSLWTLPIEVTAYAGILVIGRILLAGTWPSLVRRVGTVLMALVAVCGALAFVRVPVFPVLDYFLDQPFFNFFFFGCLLYACRDRIPLRWPLFAGAAVGFVASLFVGYMAPVYPLLAYCVIFLSTRRGALANRLTSFGDPSYGIYIYGYPVQQLLVFLKLAPNGWILFIEASALAIALGYLSWHLVESRALAFSRGMLQRRSAAKARPTTLAA